MKVHAESAGAKLRMKAALDRKVFVSAQSELAEVLHTGDRHASASAPAADSSGAVKNGSTITGYPQDLGTDRQQEFGALPCESSEGRTATPRDPLFKACNVIAKKLGVTLRPIPDSKHFPVNNYESLQHLCDASHLHPRKVLLRGDWWKRDHGPLLAYGKRGAALGNNSQHDLRPVALIPSSSTGYQLFDPVTETSTPVEAALASSIAAEAFMLYPAGVKQLLRPLDLLGPALCRHRRELLVISLIALLGGLLAALVPIITGIIYGRVIPNAYGSELSQLALVLVALTIGTCAFQITRDLSVLRVTAKLDLELQSLVWGRLLSLPVTFFRRFQVGDLADRVQGIGTIRQIFFAEVTTAVLALVVSVTSFLLLFYYSYQLALLATGLLGTFSICTFFLSRLQLNHRRRSLQIRGKISSLAFSMVQGIAKLRSGGAEALSYGVWAGHFAAQTRHRRAMQRAASLQASLNAFYLVAAELSVFALMGFELHHRLRVSSFLAFSAAFGQVQAALLTFVNLIPELLAIFPIHERLQPVLTEPAEVKETKRIVSLCGKLEARNVSYRYHAAGPAVLKNICFQAAAGEFIAIVGPSGSGKSTLLRLLLGFDEPFQGSILYDDTDLKLLDIKSVRRQIGAVLQNSKPICGDIYTNIVGGTSRTLDDAWEAARMSGIDREIKAMPMGMHTLIGEGAATFSGGERQRLMIARAVVNRPRIILLDEATSALDNPAQAHVQKCLEHLHATRIVVAHRLSTVRHADRIYVLNAGHIVEQGTYDELWNRGGYFSQMARRQMSS